MGNLAKGKSTIIKIMKLTIKEDFRRRTVFSCFSYHKITLFENKYGIKLITLMSMYHLRTTVPLVSYIRNSLRFWYYASLSTCCQNLEKKIGVTGKIWEKAGVKLLRDLTEKSVNFITHQGIASFW